MSRAKFAAKFLSLILRFVRCSCLNMKWILATVAPAVVTAAVPEGWATCGGLEPALNRTACPLATATCCQQHWAPGDGNWGCIDWANATCCANGYTACPSGSTCKDTGTGAAVVTECVPNDSTQVPQPTAGKQVCKQGAPIPFSSSLPNVLVLGDSVSIGYTPYVANVLADVALVQHSPWGGDGGAEETAYGDQCLDYLLRAPDGTELRPDVLFFNFGLHNTGNGTIPGQAGPYWEYAPHLENIVKKLRAWAGPAGNATSVKLMFALTSPMLNNDDTDQVILKNNRDAAAIMAEYDIPTVDLHAPIIAKCGPVPQTSCFNETNCWCVALGGILSTVRRTNVAVQLFHVGHHIARKPRPAQEGMGGWRIPRSSLQFRRCSCRDRNRNSCQSQVNCH